MNSNTIAKHTAGPWTLHGKYPSARVIAGNFEICITTPGRGELPSVWLANARLIAAAPELIEDVKSSAMMFDVLSRLLIEYGHADQANSCRIQAENLNATIAKVDGRT